MHNSENVQKFRHIHFSSFSAASHSSPFFYYEFRQALSHRYFDKASDVIQQLEVRAVREFRGAKCIVN